MGKKPVLGLVGLAWMGLVVGGCKDCNCRGNTRKDTQVAKRQTRQESQGRESDVASQRRTTDSSVATKGGAPHPYDFPVNQHDVPASQELPEEKPALAERTPVRREGVPQRFSDPSSEAGIPTVKKETSTGVMPTSGKTEIYEVTPPATSGKGTPSVAPGIGPDLTGGDVVPQMTAPPKSTMTDSPASKPSPALSGEKLSAAPDLPVPPSAPGGASATRELAPAAGSPLPVPSVSNLPPPSADKSASTDIAPKETVPTPVSGFPPPPPSSALRHGVRTEMPPQPPAPPGLAPLPSVSPVQ